MVDKSNTKGNGPPPSEPPLTKEHLADLKASGLSGETIAASGFYSEKDPAKVSKLLNWDNPADALGVCLVFPFFDAEGKPTGYTRVKPDRPRRDKKKGKPAKYESPCGASNRAYFPPGTRTVLKDPSAPLVITEGEKKAAKADQEGFPCIGLVGVYGWQKKRAEGKDGMKQGPRELIDDLAGIPWQRRRVYVCFDSDAAANKNVRLAEKHLAEVLCQHGVTPYVIRLPAGPAGPDGKPAKVGLDDFLMNEVPDKFRELLDKATPFQEKAPAEGGKLTIKKAFSLVASTLELWHTKDSEPFATTKERPQRTFSLKSEEAEHYVRGTIKDKHSQFIGKETTKNVLAYLGTEAVRQGPEHQVFVRLAGHDGNHYLDLGGDDWQAVKIMPGRWEVVHEVPVKFRRPSGFLPLPAPIRGGRC